MQATFTQQLACVPIVHSDRRCHHAWAVRVASVPHNAVSLSPLRFACNEPLLQEASCLREGRQRVLVRDARRVGVSIFIIQKAEKLVKLVLHPAVGICTQKTPKHTVLTLKCSLLKACLEKMRPRDESGRVLKRPGRVQHAKTSSAASPRHLMEADSRHR